MELSIDELRELTTKNGTNRVEAVAARLDVRESAPVYDYQGKVAIVILQRGWIVVGNVRQNGVMVEVENANVVRCWGTTKGLGELAANGPLANTVLDPCGAIRTHELGVVASMLCNQAKWGS